MSFAGLLPLEASRRSGGSVPTDQLHATSGMVAASISSNRCSKDTQWAVVILRGNSPRVNTRTDPDCIGSGAQRALDRGMPLRRTRWSQSAAAMMRRIQVEDSGTCAALAGVGAGTASSTEVAVFAGSKLTCTGESSFMPLVDPSHRRRSPFRICRRSSNSSSRRFGRSATGSRQSLPISHPLCATGSPPAKQPCEVFCPT